MAHEILAIKDFTNKTGGRSDCEFSGDWFLEKHLWPAVKRFLEDPDHWRVEIVFDDVEYRPGFIDQAFSKLISKYHFSQSKDCFILTCNDKNIIADVMAAIIGAEYKTFGQVYTK